MKLGSIAVHNSRGCNVPVSKQIYIGRPTVLGNPYVIGKNGTREEVIKKYEEWLREQIKDKNTPQYKFMSMLVRQYRDGKDIHLICWCKPLACHGDIIKELVEEMTYRS